MTAAWAPMMKSGRMACRAPPARRFGAHLDIAGAAHARDLTLGALATHHQAGAILLQLELNLAASADAERPPNRKGDRDLAFLRDPHAGKTGK